MPISIKQGSTIASPNVQTNRQYVDGRQIENLVKVGALTADEAALLKRVDGVIANRPPDGRPAIDEMVKLEQPDFRDTLFPQEQALQPTLWRKLEWEPAAAPAVRPTLVSLQAQISDQSVAPGTVNRALASPIAALPPDVQLTARRVQLVLNSDTDAATIALVDLDQAMASPERFTPAEVEDFHTISEELLKLQPSQPQAVLAVPMPGESRIPFVAGGLAFAIKQRTSLSEYRTMEGSGNGFYVQLDAFRSSSLEVVVALGDRAILINTETGAEMLLEAGTHKLDDLSGNFRSELWRNGNRVEVADVVLPVLGNEQVQLWQYADHELRANGVALPKRLLDANVGYRSYQNAGYQGGEHVYSAQWTYDPAQPPMLDPQKVELAKVVASPAIRLPPGRYSVDGVTLDLYSQGVVKAEYQNVWYRLQHSKLNGGQPGSYPKGFQTPSDPFIYFDPQTNQLRVSTSGQNSTVTVRPEDRVG